MKNDIKALRDIITMFSILKNFFSLSTKSPPPTIDSQESNPNFITDPQQITDMMMALDKKTLTCLIESELSDEIYTTEILEIHAHLNIFFISPLSPDLGNTLLEQQHSLKLLTQINNIQCSITVDNLVSEHKFGKLFYRVAFPNRIYYPQRRKHTRLNCFRMPIKFKGSSQRTLCSAIGQAINISEKGLAIMINTPLAPIRKLDILENCRLSLSNDIDIYFHFTVRHITEYSPNKQLIGGSISFNDTDPNEKTTITPPDKQQQYLSSFINELNAENNSL